jgi:hypothetical protein
VWSGRRRGGVATLNRQTRFGSAATSINVSKTLTNWLLAGPITESASSTSRLCCTAATFLTRGLGRPGRGIPKDVLNKQNQGHVSAVCARYVDRVKILSTWPYTATSAETARKLTWQRDEDNIAAEARLDGIHVIRAAKVPGETSISSSRPS